MSPPRLKGPSLELRPYRAADRASFVALFCDDLVMEHVDGAMRPEAAGVLFDAIVGTSPPSPRVHSAWLAEDSEGRAVGHGALLRRDDELEIGFILRPEAWGKGHATEIARILVQHGRHDLGRSHLVATVDTTHEASKRVLAKAGLVLVETIRDDDGDYLLYSTQRD